MKYLDVYVNIPCPKACFAFENACELFLQINITIHLSSLTKQHFLPEFQFFF